MIVDQKQKDGFFRVALTRFDWRSFEEACRAFIEDVKAFRPADERDFDDNANEWVFANEHYSSVLTLARVHFPGRVKED